MGGHTAKTTHRVVDAESGTHIELITVPLSKYLGTSLVAQWLRILLPMQGTWVRSLVWEDFTCHRATKPMGHNY